MANNNEGILEIMKDASNLQKENIFLEELVDTHKEDNGSLYVDYKLIEGEDLYHYLEKNNVSDAEKLVWIYFIADQLETLHKKVVHRDICPKNIIIDSNHYPHIVNYDVAQKIGRPIFDDRHVGTAIY